jgi:hypothetical protein
MLCWKTVGLALDDALWPHASMDDAILLVTPSWLMNTKLNILEICFKESSWQSIF